MPKAKTQIEFVKEIQDKYNGEYIVLGEYKRIHSPILMRHTICGNEWNTTAPYDLLKVHPNTCPKCAHPSKPLTNDIYQKKLDTLFGKGVYLVKGKYINNKTKLRLKHNCGKMVMPKPNTILSGKYNCQHCETTNSVVSRNVEYVLDNLDIGYEKEKTFDWLKFKDNLYIDYYLYEYNIAIEADGEQHYVPKRGGEVEFYKTLERDKYKYTLCKENDIALIRVPSWLPKHQLVPFLEKLLYDNNVIQF